MMPVGMLPAMMLDGIDFREREYSNPIPKLKPSDMHTSYAQNKRNSKKIKNRKRQKK